MAIHKLDPLPAILWHGTTLANAQDIASGGALGALHPASRPEDTAEICLSDDRATATFFAIVQARRSAKRGVISPPVLIAVPRNALNPDMIRADTNLLASPFGPLERINIKDPDAINAFLEQASTLAHNWRHSLEKVHAIMHQGPMALENVVIDTSIITAPMPASDQELDALEYTGMFPQGWVLPDPSLHTITPDQWSWRAHDHTPVLVDPQSPRKHMRALLRYQSQCLLEPLGHSVQHFRGPTDGVAVYGSFLHDLPDALIREHWHTIINRNKAPLFLES